MEYRRLGKSGLQVSALSFGSWMTFAEQIGDETASDLMAAAYDAGVNFFDNAEVYASGKSEESMGRALKKFGWDRSSYVVSSKVFFGSVPGEPKPNQNGLNRKHVVEACHAALRRLQVDYLDLYFCHRADLKTPVEETVFAMNDLIRQGKVLYWGTSEWPASRIMAAHAAAERLHLEPPVMEQTQYSLLVRDRFEKEYHEMFNLLGYGATTWSPLASGMLTDKYLAGQTGGTRSEKHQWLLESQAGKAFEAKRPAIAELALLAKELGMSLAGLSLAWCLKNPNVSTVITGASRVEQVQENMKALENFSKLTPEILAKIDGLLGNKPDLNDWTH